MRYRRACVQGGTYFFTVNLANRSQRLLTERADLLRDVTRIVQSNHPFEIVAVVVLPEHLHCMALARRRCRLPVALELDQRRILAWYGSE